MSVAVEAFFTSALGLQAPWIVAKVELDTAKKRIDCEVTCNARKMICPACGVSDQGRHDRIRREWRHLDFFQFEAWLMPMSRVDCSACGKTTLVAVPWARPGSGFTLLFEALALTLCQFLPVAQAAAQLRLRSKQLWNRIEHYVQVARSQDVMSGVAVIGIDETSIKRGHEYVTVVHDLTAKRLLFMTAGRTHQSVVDFKADMVAHGGDPADIDHVCMDMSAAYTKDVTEALPEAQISYDRYHVIALANEAMDAVRREEMRSDSKKVRIALGSERKMAKGLLWGMRKDPSDWNQHQRDTMYFLQRSNLRSARAWRLKQGLRDVYKIAVAANSDETAKSVLQEWISWARRSSPIFPKARSVLPNRLLKEPFTATAVEFHTKRHRARNGYA